jgi:hypothetical protein
MMNTDNSKGLLVRATRDKLHDDGERRDASAGLGSIAKI